MNKNNNLILRNCSFLSIEIKNILFNEEFQFDIDDHIYMFSQQCFHHSEKDK